MSSIPSSALRPFLIEYFSTVESASTSDAFEAVQQAGLPYKRSTVKAMLNEDRANFQRITPGVFRLHPGVRGEVVEEEPRSEVVALPSLDCSRCGRPMIPSCGCELPTDVVLAALRATLENVGGGPLKLSSLHVAVLTDELFERGCVIAGVRREIAAAS